MWEPEDSFFITLVSNSSKKMYPKNTPASFVNKFPKRLNFSEDMELALIEIHFPYNMCNVYNNNSRAWVKKGDKILTRSIVPENYVSEPESVLTKLQQELQFYTIKMKDDHIVFQNQTKENLLLIMTKTLSMQLGFPLGTMFADYEVKAPSKPDFNIGLPSHMFVYCDIIKPHIVGNNMRQLLRNVTINTKKYCYGGHGHITFSHPQYLPVNVTETDQITIDIKDSDDCLVPFISGNSSLLLHFRRRYDQL